MQIENRLEWRKGMEELTLLGERAVQAKYELQRMTTEKKNEVLGCGGINPKHGVSSFGKSQGSGAWNCKSDESRAG